LNSTTLESLLEKEVPDVLLVTTVVVDVNLQKVEHYTGYIIDPIDDNLNDNLSNKDVNKLNKEENTFKLYNIDDLAELRNSGITYADDIPTSEWE
ncbi:17827_t:CDS:1, partial [Cetraspora pellucida]